MGIFNSFGCGTKSSKSSSSSSAGQNSVANSVPSNAASTTSSSISNPGTLGEILTKVQNNVLLARFKEEITYIIHGLLVRLSSPTTAERATAELESLVTNKVAPFLSTQLTNNEAIGKIASNIAVAANLTLDAGIPTGPGAASYISNQILNLSNQAITEAVSTASNEVAKLAQATAAANSVAPGTNSNTSATEAALPISSTVEPMSTSSSTKPNTPPATPMQSSVVLEPYTASTLRP